MTLEGAIAIISSLDSCDKDLAAEFLGKMGPAAAPAIPALMDSLLFWISDGPFGEGETLAFWYTGAETLAKIGPAAVEALVERLKDRDLTSDRRWSAAIALGRIGLPLAEVALPALEIYRTDKDLRVKRHAINAAARIRTQVKSQTKEVAQKKVRSR